MAMSCEDGMKLIATSQEKINEDKLYLRWCIGYQFGISFDEFKNQLTTRTDSGEKCDVVEVMKKVRQIMNEGITDGDI
jgi:hypothetical protein